MKKRRKVLSVMLCAAMIASLAACGSKGDDDVIYEVEAQKENTHNLPKRSRLYQGIIDSKLLLPGGIPRTDRTFEIYGTQYR